MMLSFLVCPVDYILHMLVFEILYNHRMVPIETRLSVFCLSLSRTPGIVPRFARAAEMGYHVHVVGIVPNMRCEHSPHLMLAKLWFSTIANKDPGSERPI